MTLIVRIASSADIPQQRGAVRLEKNQYSKQSSYECVNVESNRVRPEYVPWRGLVAKANMLVVLRRTVCCRLPVDRSAGSSRSLSALSANAPSQLDVLWHDGDALGVDGAQVGVFEKANQVGLASFLKGHHGRTLEAEVRLEVLSNFPHQALKGKLADQKFGRFLVTANFTQGHGTRAISMRFLNPACGRGTLASSLGSKLLTRSLATGTLASGLLCSGHSASDHNECWNENGASCPERLASPHSTSLSSSLLPIGQRARTRPRARASAAFARMLVGADFRAVALFAAGKKVHQSDTNTPVQYSRLRISLAFQATVQSTL